MLARQFQVREQLCFMNWGNLFNALEFEYHGLLYN
jgi:hypothetical protein